jgi:glycosyltransferase involved in cell wall biosynthesis
VKVLHVIPALAPRYGGPSSSIVEMCGALMASGVSVLIATTDADGPHRLDVPIGRPTDWHGTQTIFFPRQWSEAFKFSAPLGRWLETQVREWDVVHIHAPLSYSSLAAARAATRHSVPFIVRPLGTLDSWSMQQKALKKRVLMPFVLRALRRAAALHYTSTQEMRDVETAFRLSGGVVIPLGVQLTYLNAPALADAGRVDNRYVLALSRLHPVKNLEALIDAFCDLRSDGIGPEWRLVVAGAGDEGYAGTLQARIAARGAADFILRRDWVDGDEKRDLVRGASVFALTSHHENFGVGLVEAMAAGVPAVVSNGVHLAEAIRAAGAGWVTGTSRESIRDGLLQAIQDDRSRAVRGAAARSFATQFAWPAVAHRLIELYERTRTTAAAHNAGPRSQAAPEPQPVNR